MYALYKVLAAGHRAVYDPGTYVLHQHRPDSRWMHRTFWGYGVGLSAVLTKVMVEQRELAAPAVWWWLWRQYREVVVRGLMGDAQPVAVRIGWDYLRGGLMGAAAWRAARRQLPASERRPAPGRASSPAPARAPPRGERRRDPRRSRCRPDGRPARRRRALPGGARPRARRRCPLRGRRSSTTRPRVQADGTAVAPPAPTWVRSIRTGGAGAAAARNAGAAAARADLLLFLDDDLVPEPGLVRHHIERHRAAAAGRIVIGYSPPRPALRTLAALGAALWWEDHYRGKRDAGAMTFVEALSGNMSISRATWERLGAFDVDFGRLRREDWEWGIRALQAGTEIVYAPEAVAAHEFTLHDAGKLAHARNEGAGDALLLERYPAALPSLPAAGWPRELAYGRRAPALLLLRSARLRRAMVPALDALEWARARQLWQRLFLLAYVAAYDAGFRAGGGRRGASPVLLVELTSEEPLPPPAVVAPIIEVRLRGRRVSGFRPEEGRWSGALAQRIASAVPWAAWHAMAQAGPDRAGDPQLTGLTVLLGPARRPGDDRHALALEAAGADVRRLDGPRDAHWAEIARAARAAPAAAIVVPMPGVALNPERLAPALPALAADRVDALVVIGRSWLERPSPLYLASAAVGSRPYAVPDAPPDYVLLPAGRGAALGESVASLEELGPAAPVLELVQRILDGGGVVATRDVPAAPGSAASLRRRRWDLHRSRASLFAWRATSIGPVHGALWGLRFSAAPVAAALVRSAKYGEPRPSAALGRAAAFVAGTARAASVGRRRRRGHRGGRRPDADQPPAADATRQRWGGRNTPPSEESPSTRQRIDVPVEVVGVAPVALVDADVDEVLAGDEVEALEDEADELAREPRRPSATPPSACSCRSRRCRRRRARSSRRDRGAHRAPGRCAHRKLTSSAPPLARPVTGRPAPSRSSTSVDRRLLAAEAVAPQLERRRVASSGAGVRSRVSECIASRYSATTAAASPIARTPPASQPHGAIALARDLVEAVRGEQHAGARGRSARGRTRGTSPGSAGRRRRSPRRAAARRARSWASTPNASRSRMPSL